MTEVWKPVVGFETSYEVSDRGSVRSVERVIQRRGNSPEPFNTLIEAKILKPIFRKSGYIKYGLCRGTRRDIKWVLAHRLVAEAFIPNPNNYPFVHHIDHNKSNNHVSNLEWCTPSYNTKAAIAAGKHRGGFKMGTKHHSGKFTSDQIDWMKRLKYDGYTLDQIGSILNASKSYISQVLNGSRRITTPSPNNSGELKYCKQEPVEVKLIPFIYN